MFREAIGKAETILLAKEEACRILGVKMHEAEFEILQEPVKKTLGMFGGKLAEVRAFVKDSPVELAENYIKSILDAMKIESYKMEKEETEDGVEFSITGDKVGNIIGHRGETLDAIQYLACLVANNKSDKYYRLSINVGNYREKRKNTLESLGINIAKKSLKFKRNFSLEPMNPYERRIIHSSVQKIDGVTSWSEGENMNRHVVIGINKNRRNNGNIKEKNNINLDIDNNIGIASQGEAGVAPLYGKLK